MRRSLHRPDIVIASVWISVSSALSGVGSRGFRPRGFFVTASATTPSAAFSAGFFRFARGFVVFAAGFLAATGFFLAASRCVASGLGFSVCDVTSFARVDWPAASGSATRTRLVGRVSEDSLGAVGLGVGALGVIFVGLAGALGVIFVAPVVGALGVIFVDPVGALGIIFVAPTVGDFGATTVAACVGLSSPSRGRFVDVVSLGSVRVSDGGGVGGVGCSGDRDVALAGAGLALGVMRTPSGGLRGAGIGMACLLGADFDIGGG